MKLLEDIRKSAMPMIQKDLSELKPKELELLLAYCNLHEGICEMLKFEEKAKYVHPQEHAEHAERKWKAR